MYWLLGSNNTCVGAPRSLRPEEHAQFQKAMEAVGWVFTRRDLSPMSEDYFLKHKAGPDQGITRWYVDSKRWETETHMPGRLLQMYEEMGVMKDGKALPLCDHCPSHISCWLGLDARKPAGNKVESSHISLPWIGEKYGDRRITVVGVNPNEGGGLLFFPTLVRQAVKELEKGKILVNFGDETYKGTTLWHGIGKIAAELLSIWQDEFDFSRLSSADSYSYLAITNHIKCSPLDERSRPSNEMWKNCGNTILKKELDTLRPEILMVLGRRENMYAMDHRVFDRPATWKYESKYIRFGHAPLGGRRVAVLNVPHPAIGIGKSPEVLNEVKLILSHYPRQEIIGLY